MVTKKKEEKKKQVTTLIADNILEPKNGKKRTLKVVT